MAYNRHLFFMRHHFPFQKALFTLLLCCISISVLHAQTDVALQAILSPYKGASIKDSTPVSVIIKNTGTDSITTVKIAFQFNGVTHPTYQWTGKMAKNASDTVTIGKIFADTGKNQLKAYVFLPNNNNNSLHNICRLCKNPERHLLRGRCQCRFQRYGRSLVCT